MVHGMLDDTMVAAHHQTFRTYEYEGREYRVWNPAVAEANVALVRGAMWAAAAVDQPWVDAILLDIGLHYGTSGTSSNEVRDERLANSAAAALGSRPGSGAIAALGRMKATIGNRNVSKQIAKALEVAAERAGISPSELLELAVPTYGLDADGRLEIEVGDHVAVAAIDGDDVRLDLAGARWPRDRDSPRGDRRPEGRRRARQGAGQGAAQGARARARAYRGPVHRGSGVGLRRLASPLPRASVHGLDRPTADLDGGAGRRRRTRRRWSMATRSSPRTDPRSTSAPDDRIRLWHPIDAAEAEIAAWRAGCSRARCASRSSRRSGRCTSSRRPRRRPSTSRTGSPATSCATRRPGP